MDTLIACFVAGVFAAGFVTLWFRGSYRELAEKQRSLTGLREQLVLHERLYDDARGGPDEGISASMLETSRMLVLEASKGYNELLRRPANRIPALVLGFRPTAERR